MSSETNLEDIFTSNDLYSESYKRFKKNKFEMKKHGYSDNCLPEIVSGSIEVSGFKRYNSN